MKVLILRFSSIGDIVLTTPVIRCIKQQVPNVELHYATKASYQSILQSNPYIDKLHYLENSPFELAKDLKKEQFDVIIDLHNNQRTLLIKTLLNVKAYSFDKINIQKWLLTTFKIDRLPKKHIVARYLQTTKALEVQNDHKGLDYFIDKKDEVNLSEIDKRLNADFIAFAIGAKFKTKQMPLSKIFEVVKKINIPFVLLGGKEDFEKGAKIKSEFPEKTIINLAGKLNLNQSASLVKQAKVVLTHDTGLMHIAAAFNKKIVSVWGNTTPQFGMYPYLKEEHYKIVEVNNLSCRPCSKIGYAKCPKQHFKCMENIDTTQVVKNLKLFFD